MGMYVSMVVGGELIHQVCVKVAVGFYENCKVAEELGRLAE